MNPMSVEHLIRKVSRYVTFGQPVSIGSLINQRISDPRVPITAYYLGMKTQNDPEHFYHEVWLKKEGSFAITEAWYKESTLERKLLKDNLSFEQLKISIGEADSQNIVLRMAEIISKSEKQDWKPQTRRA